MEKVELELNGDKLLEQRLTLDAITLYPVKSLGGIALNGATVKTRGLRYDRRWMLVDCNAKFLTQRDYPEMAKLSLALTPLGLTVDAPGLEPLHIPFAPLEGTTLTVKVWRSVSEAIFVGGVADNWFSHYLHAPVRLVMMPETAQRPINPDYARTAEDFVSFADGYPYMLLSEASLADLNARLAHPLPMNRFRPNFVVAGAEPYAEDGWKKIAIGDSTFHVVKPCDRCVITTINQETAERGIEPLQTLAQYRTVQQKVLFGQYLIPETQSQVQVGDPVRVIERHSPGEASFGQQKAQ